MRERHIHIYIYIHIQIKELIYVCLSQMYYLFMSIQLSSAQPLLPVLHIFGGAHFLHGWPANFPGGVELWEYLVGIVGSLVHQDNQI